MRSGYAYIIDYLACLLIVKRDERVIQSVFLKVVTILCLL